MERQHGQNNLEVEELKKEILNFQTQLEKVVENIASYQENIKDLMKTTGVFHSQNFLYRVHYERLLCTQSTADCAVKQR